jgi:hypothetical protein
VEEKQHILGIYLEEPHIMCEMNSTAGFKPTAMRDKCYDVP